MKFGPVPLAQAEGKILGHNISNHDGKRVLRKGVQISEDDVDLLAEIGRSTVYVAEPMPGDVGENLAAERVTRAVCGDNALTTKPNVGRVNLLAGGLSVLRVDASRLTLINACEGVTLATLPSHSVVPQKKIAATIKVIPLALPEAIVSKAERMAADGDLIVELYPLRRRMAALILSSSPYAKSRVRRDFVPAIQGRLESLGSDLNTIDFVPLEDETGEIGLAEMIQARVAEGAEIIILAGETAIMDRFDIAPRAVERSGGEVVSYGAPVDPGNLLMLAYLDGVPILGAPGCVRSRKTNVIDWVLPPLLAGDHLSKRDIIHLGHGGLLEDIPKRPMPRE
jgi:molybdenum cofactor cytidylyltransferase